MLSTVDLATLTVTCACTGDAGQQVASPWMQAARLVAPCVANCCRSRSPQVAARQTAPPLRAAGPTSGPRRPAVWTAEASCARGRTMAARPSCAGSRTPQCVACRSCPICDSYTPTHGRALASARGTPCTHHTTTAHYPRPPHAARSAAQRDAPVVHEELAEGVHQRHEHAHAAHAPTPRRGIKAHHLMTRTRPLRCCAPGRDAAVHCTRACVPTHNDEVRPHLWRRHSAHAHPAHR